MSKTENSRLDKRLDTIESTMVTKDEFHQAIGQVRDQMVTRDQFNTTMDEVLTIVKRLDEERIFTIEWVRRIEADVERMKKHLHLV